MPNWCSNHMTAAGEPAAMSKFFAVLDRLTPDNDLFELFVPVPSEIADVSDRTVDYGKPTQRTTYHRRQADGSVADLSEEEVDRLKATHGQADEYEWHLEHWGARCGPSTGEVAIERETRSCDLTFDTAWSPPLEWFKQVCAQFPELAFTLAYAEQGMGFAGEMVGERGAAHEVIDYSGCLWRDTADDEELEYEIPEDIHPAVRGVFERHPQLQAGG